MPDCPPPRRRPFGLHHDFGAALEHGDFGLGSTLDPLNYSMLSPDLSSVKKSKSAKKCSSGADMSDFIEPRRLPSLGDDDSIKEDCEGNEDELVIKGPWSEPEDEQLRLLVAEQGAKRWSAIAARLPGRIGKQVRACLPTHRRRLASGARRAFPRLCRPAGH